MTEAEWLAADRASDLICFLRYSELGPALAARGRKYRLFAVACLRRTPGADERTVEIAERMADGRVTREELALARAGASGAARKALLRSGRMAANDVARPLGSDSIVASALRDVFGNPF